MDLVDQFKQNEEDFLKNRLDLDEDLDPETDQEYLSDNDLYLDTEEKQRARSNTMKGVAACFKCKSADSKIRVWHGPDTWAYHFRCTGCGEKLKPRKEKK